MLPGSIQITGEALSGAEIKDICDSLKENSVRLLSVRGCQLSDRDFGRVCRGVAESHSLAQLNLNLGVVSTIGRTKQLADALKANRSLQTLFLHGSPLLDAGLVTLNGALSTHPSLVSLDLGDCMLGDEAVRLICGMLPPDGAKSGLKELTLSANPAVSTQGWARLAIAVAHSSQLRVLNLDYNPLESVRPRFRTSPLSEVKSAGRFPPKLSADSSLLLNPKSKEEYEEKKTVGSSP
ncbi:leucine-rich repeat-containing protein 73-like [Sinocyclocheilus rhinocerous]|uniref:leucine-rich repeat-containing protein 73-like n=1 Tax=Sinocyclocheilus rhinocerous TaxID=307959 RepID=UPI0007B82D73|nr:PREDICTED: leucine-rich repeat-containing protein 73-like [Sinocyclocheilus rhinocerous]